MINVGCCEVLDLRKAPKGEVVTVGVALHGIGYIFFFAGIVKLWFRVRTNARRWIGTQRGLDLVKVSLGFFLSCLSVLLPKVFPHPFRTHCPGAKGDISQYVAPLIN